MSFWSFFGAVRACIRLLLVAGVLMCVEHQRNDGNHKDLPIAIRVRVADSIALISIKLCFFFFNLIKIFRFSVIKLMF